MRYRIGGGLLLAITLWDVDAMIPHITACSWYTLGIVSLMLAGHLADIFTSMYMGNVAEEVWSNR